MIQNWKRGLFEGLLLLLLGILALAYPLISTWSFAAFFGLLITLAGGALALRTYSKKGRSDLLSLITGLGIALVGLLMIFYPGFGARTLTLIIALYFLLDGAVRLVASFRLPKPMRPSWLPLSAALSLMLALLIWLGFPTVSLWLVGTLVGLHLLLSGATLIAFTLAMRKTQV